MIECSICGEKLARGRGRDTYPELQRESLFIHLLHAHDVGAPWARVLAYEQAEIRPADREPDPIEVRWEPARDAWRRGQPERSISEIYGVTEKAFRARRRQWWSSRGWFPPRR